jgi:small subunit ribosomal protein S5
VSEEENKPAEEKAAATEAAPVTNEAPKPAEAAAPQSSDHNNDRRQGRFGGGRGNGPGGRGGPRGRREREVPTDEHGNELTEKVLFINRSSKVVKGGRRFGFSALVVTGDKKGKVGIGLGKANEVADAIRKGGENSRAAMAAVSISGNTIPHEVYSVYDGARVILRPASKGTGLIAGKTVRAILESVGLHDVLSKSLGSNNAANVAKATLQALQSCRTRDDIRNLRGQDPIAVPAAAKEDKAEAATAASE